MEFYLNLERFHLEYIIAIMGVTILYLLYFIFTKDAQYSKNIHFLASTIETINQELFKLNKKNIATQNNIDLLPSRMSDDEIYQEIERSVYDMVKPLSENLIRVEELLKISEQKIDARVSSLESGVKQIALPLSIHAKDDEKIMHLFNQGINVETISKELHISKAEVEFALKIHKIHKT